jgi:DNA-directed RNA polymerase
LHRAKHETTTRQSSNTHKNNLDIFRRGQKFNNPPLSVVVTGETLASLLNEERKSRAIIHEQGLPVLTVIVANNDQRPTTANKMGGRAMQQASEKLSLSFFFEA